MKREQGKRENGCFACMGHTNATPDVSHQTHPDVLWLLRSPEKLIFWFLPLKAIGRSPGSLMGHWEEVFFLENLSIIGVLRLTPPWKSSSEDVIETMITMGILRLT